MLNFKKQRKVIFLSIKNLKWWKKIMVLEFLIFLATVSLSHSSGACVSHGFVGQMPEAYFTCTQYISFFEYFGLKYFYFAFVLFLILVAFLSLTFLLGRLTGRTFSKKNSYKKVFVVELWGGLALFFLFIMFLILLYDGQSCMADNCVAVSLFIMMSWWGPLVLLPLIFNPVTLGVVAFPYLVVFVVKEGRKRLKSGKK